MQYAKLNTEKTYSHQITTTAPIEWDENNYCTAEALVRDGLAAQFYVVELHETDAPEIDLMTQTVIRDGGEFVDGIWQYKWRVDKKTVEQIAIDQSNSLAQSQENIRTQRNIKLAACDWTQVIDAPVDQVAWSTYRQALRDIPQQAGFPQTVVWPTQPE